jgi:hypothetical protein
MPLPSALPQISFERAMSIHVLRACGWIFSDLTALYRANPGRFAEILDGKLHPGSWETALAELKSGRTWSPEVEELVATRGLESVFRSLAAADPSVRRAKKTLKRLKMSWI